MSSWGEQRRNHIILAVALLFIVLASVILYFALKKEPTCFDGKENGDETGVDCGGSCALVCQEDVIAPLVHWTRYFEVVPSIYNAVAYVENLNPEFGSTRADYVFKLYDSKNVVLTERKGSINIRPKEIIPVVANVLNTGQLKPVRATFEFTNQIIWEKMPPKDQALIVSGERYFEVDSLPRISAVLSNKSIYEVKDIDVVVIVYDAQDNAITTSSTVFKSIAKDQSVDLIFTWPQRFAKTMNRFEIVPLYDASN